MSAWVLPDHIADGLPAEARRIEDLRRRLLDTAQGYGYELVMPPMLEHIESLLTGTGESLDLLTFKLVDQLSGRTLGIRADTTPQVARIDAHILNRQGVTRLCYCGPVLHTRPGRPHASREPLQFGAEIYGAAGIEADGEVLRLVLECLRTSGCGPLTVDLGDARIVRALLPEIPQDSARRTDIQSALATKDAPALKSMTAGLADSTAAALLALVSLYGDSHVIEEARRALPPHPAITDALDQMRRLAATVGGEAEVTFDLADMPGFAYYSGARFAVYTPGSVDALARGGRYDEVGAVFGRSRPAVGFSLDVKELAAVVQPASRPTAICTSWVAAGDPAGASQDAAIARLRRQGEVVVRTLPEQAGGTLHVAFDRELVFDDGEWILRSI